MVLIPHDERTDSAQDLRLPGQEYRGIVGGEKGGLDCDEEQVEEVAVGSRVEVRDLSEEVS